MPRGRALALEAAFAACISLVAAAIVLQLWRADLRVPFKYTSDALAVGTTVKGLHENGWYFYNPSLGAPFGQQFLDYPLTDLFHLIVLKAIQVVAPGFGAALNLQFLIGFALITACAHAVFRLYGRTCAVSAAAAILFAHLPYRYYRGILHPFLVAYVSVPLTLGVALWFAGGRTAYLGADSHLSNRGRWLRRSGLVLAVAVIAGSGVYATAFSAFAIGVAAMFGFLHTRRRAVLIEGFAVSVLTIVITIAFAAPSIIHSIRNGPNEAVATRSPLEAELYAVRIGPLVLPSADHRLDGMAAIRKMYDQRMGLISAHEGGSTTLGLICSLGFIGLLGAITARIEDIQLRFLCVMNAAFLLLALPGGLSGLIAAFLTAGLRGYNRVAPYLAFVALFALAVVVDRFQAKRKLPAGVFHAIAALAVIAGLLDQTNAAIVPEHESNRTAFYKDRAFIQSIEASLPSNAMIFQIPYVAWPENGPTHGMADYELFRGYLHSSRLRWSYGAMRGRYADAWLKRVSSLQPAEMLRILAITGFSGVYVDRRGLADRGQGFEQNLLAAVGPPSMLHPDGSVAYYRIVEFREQMRAQHPPATWEQMRAAVLSPLSVTWDNGCYGLEGGASPAETWRWCQPEAALSIENPDSRPRRLNLTVRVSPAVAEDAKLVLSGPVWSETVTIPKQGIALQKQLVAPVGRSRIRMTFLGKTTRIPADPRTFAVRLANMQMSSSSSSVEGPPSAPAACAPQTAECWINGVLEVN